MKEIPLTQGKFTIVDDEDYDFLMQWKWFLLKCKCGVNYASNSEGGKHVLMHRKIFKHYNIPIPANGLIDHAGMDGLDNRKENLRIADKTLNAINSKINKKNTSGHKGVDYRRYEKRIKKWRARIRYYKKEIHIGTFENKEDAARAYDSKAKELYGEFARLNFPEEVL